MVTREEGKALSPKLEQRRWEFFKLFGTDLADKIAQRYNDKGRLQVSSEIVPGLDVVHINLRTKPGEDVSRPGYSRLDVQLAFDQKSSEEFARKDKSAWDAEQERIVKLVPELLASIGASIDDADQIKDGRKRIQGLEFQIT